MARRQQTNRERNRTTRPYERRAGTRESLPSVLIVCEGKKTEPKYFNAMKKAWGLKSVSVVGGRGGDCLTIAGVAAEHASDYDQCWCVFDTEMPDNRHKVQKAIGKAQGSDVGLAISNPAFEFWLLLHFKCTTGEFDSAARVIQELREYLPGYEKAADVFEHLAPNIDTAIERAEQVLRSHTSAGNGEFANPSTTVHRLVQELLKLYERRVHSVHGDVM